MTRFDRATTPVRLGTETFSVELDEGWWAGNGPNGGYLAAVLVRAIEEQLADESRRIRSISIHFLSKAEGGPAEVEVATLREGRSVSTFTASLRQGGKLIATCLGAIGTDRDGPEFIDASPPILDDPESITEGVFAPAIPSEYAPQIASRYNYRRAIGAPPFTESAAAETGGWIQLNEPRRVDAPLLAAMSDAWMPAMFSRVGGPWGITTVDLTIHFRTDPRHLFDEWCRIRFQSIASMNGYCEEDCEIWSRDGQLLAQSRQLAALIRF